MWKKYLKHSLTHSWALTFTAATTIALTSSSAFAQEMSEAEILKAYGDAFGGVMLNNPTQVNWKTMGKGAKGKVVKAQTIRGEQAYQIKIKTPGRNHWDISISNPVVSDIKTGDVVQMIVTARAAKPEKNSGVGVAQIRLQQSGAPYTGIAEGILTLSEEWQMHYINGTAQSDYKAKDMTISFNIGSAKQTLEFGQFYIVNKGQGYDISKLPTKSTSAAE